MAVRIALGAGVAAVAIALLIVLLDSAPRLAGTNRVRDAGPGLELRPGRAACQEGELIPGDAAAVRLRLDGEAPLPSLRVRVVDVAGRSLAARRLPDDTPPGEVEIPIDQVEQTTTGDLCFATPGRGLALGGEGGRARLEWVRAGSESWLELAPTVAHRLSLAKANPVGGLLAVAIGLIMVGAWIAAMRLMLREVGR